MMKNSETASRNVLTLAMILLAFPHRGFYATENLEMQAIAVNYQNQILGCLNPTVRPGIRP